MTRNHSNGPCRKATTDKLLNLISREIVTFIVYIRNYFVLAVNIKPRDKPVLSSQTFL